MADKKNNKRNNRNMNNDDDFNPKFKKRKKLCPLCKDKNFVLDYKNAEQLKKFINERGKISETKLFSDFIEINFDRKAEEKAFYREYAQEILF